MNHLNLLTPGPVPMPPEVYQALQRPMTHHRTPEFMAVINHCRQQLKKVFNTQEPVIVLTSTGSGAMESAVVNILSTHDEVLVVVSGKFGERWCDMCNVYGVKKVHELQVPWGKSVSAQEIDNYLQKHPQITAVLTQHCETSTGALHPVKEIAQILKKYPKILFFVDAITAIGAEELKMDEWGVDVICAGSQKAFMMPTGLSFIALSAKAWQASKNSDFPKYYFDLKAELKAQEKNQTFFSSSITHFMALDAYFNYLDQHGGLTASINRCHLLAKVTRKALEIFNLKVFTHNPSASLTVIELPPQIDGQKLRQHLEDKYNVIFMGGQEQLQGKIIRIGHLGYITDENMIEGILALGHALIDFDFNLEESQIKEAKSTCLKIFKEGL